MYYDIIWTRLQAANPEIAASSPERLKCEIWNFPTTIIGFLGAGVFVQNGIINLVKDNKSILNPKRRLLAKNFRCWKYTARYLFGFCWSHTSLLGVWICLHTHFWWQSGLYSRCYLRRKIANIFNLYLFLSTYVKIRRFLLLHTLLDLYEW